MIAVDANILVYAHRTESEFHSTAAEVIRDLSEGNRLWALPWPCLHEFFCVVTHPKIYDPPTPAEQAIHQIDAWISSPALALFSESGGYWPRLRPLLETGKVRGSMVYDAKIAAICIENGIEEFWTVDRDYSRFPGLKTRNPLL
ncbi:PIN domain-containing protein [Glycomyces sp. L485]|uniref:type II toxin-antitoxin system VapC family toxin n=1 Tax=Glycomyces sp. L485 TaxID=2909235 RepID=UPI001F4B4224|nr:PIN domain-containing protein [Glycomyces sp. L485]